jgi:hypothetical protein
MDDFTHIGLDVHKDTIAVAVLRPGTVVCDERVIANTAEALRKLLSRYPDRPSLRTCYEAGPIGYDTHRPNDRRAAKPQLPAVTRPPTRQTTGPVPDDQYSLQFTSR